jgi:hypothetical protein
LHLTGLVHARALFEARGATPEDMDTLDHRLTDPWLGDHGVMRICRGSCEV